MTMMLKITDHFSYDELTATDKGELQAKNREAGTGYLLNLTALAKELEKVREFFRAPVKVHSAFRCPELNAAVGGAPTSDHTTGRAADFSVVGYEDLNGLRFVFEWCRNNTSFRQLILERPEGRKPWIHLAVPRPGEEGKPGRAMEYDGKKYTDV